jgi:hypothetical protein
MKVQAVLSSATFANFNHSKLCYIPEDETLPGHNSDSLKFHTEIKSPRYILSHQ